MRRTLILLLGIVLLSVPFSLGDYAYNLTELDYSGKSFTSTPRMTAIGLSDLAFKSDGTKMYLMDGIGDFILEYSLSTAWDITTATYSGNNETCVDCNGGLDVSSDGNTFYSSDTPTDRIREYDLSSSWDISTATKGDTYYFGNQQPTGLKWSSDGSELFWSAGNDAVIAQHSASTPWDVTTLSSTDTYTSAGNGDGLDLNDDGTKLFMLSRQDNIIRRYDMSTAYDLTTISNPSKTFDLTDNVSAITDARGIKWGDSGTKLYVASNNNGIIYQYEVPSDSPCSYTNGDWIIEEECRISENVNIDIGASIIVKNGGKLLLDGGYSIW